MGRLNPRIAIVLILAICISMVATSAQVSPGVQSGNWIDYNVNSTGVSYQGHDVEWARMEVINVQAPNVTIKITSNFTDGTSEAIISTLNFETGHLIDDFIIPAGLKVGDSFPDENYGNVTITGSDVRTYAGAQRTVLTAMLGNNSYVWDQETGVSVEGKSISQEYSIYSLASGTNMWTPTPTQAENGLTSAIITVAVVVIIFGLIIIGAIAHRNRRNVYETAPVNPGLC